MSGHFLQVIDERGKNYCVKGDEEADSRVVELVRGPLALAIKQILCHGLRQSNGIVSSLISHPWPFIG